MYCLISSLLPAASCLHSHDSGTFVVRSQIHISVIECHANVAPGIPSSERYVVEMENDTSRIRKTSFRHGNEPTKDVPSVKGT